MEFSFLRPLCTSIYTMKEREKYLAEILLFNFLIPFFHGVSTNMFFLFSVLIIDLCPVAFGTETLSSSRLVESVGCWATLPVMIG